LRNVMDRRASISGDDTAMSEPPRRAPLACVTAAASLPAELRSIGARTIGCSMPRTWINRLQMGIGCCSLLGRAAGVGNVTTTRIWRGARSESPVWTMEMLVPISTIIGSAGARDDRTSFHYRYVCKISGNAQKLRIFLSPSFVGTGYLSPVLSTKSFGGMERLKGRRRAPTSEIIHCPRTATYSVQGVSRRRTKLRSDL
jgi:hypothetical protein